MSALCALTQLSSEFTLLKYHAGRVLLADTLKRS